MKKNIYNFENDNYPMKRIRTYGKLRQEDVAEILGVNQGTISRMESKKILSKSEYIYAQYLAAHLIKYYSIKID